MPTKSTPTSIILSPEVLCALNLEMARRQVSSGAVVSRSSILREILDDWAARRATSCMENVHT